MARRAWRYTALEKNSQAVLDFCSKYQFDCREINRRYQLRIEGVLDVYPVRQRWHWLPTNERGSWSTILDIRRILLEKLPGGEKNV